MGNELAVQVGARLRRVRNARRKTQAVIAGLSGITTDYLYQIERGLKLPTLPVLAALAQALGVPVAELLGDTTAKRVAPRKAAATKASNGANGADEPLGDVLLAAVTQPVTIGPREPLAVPVLHQDIQVAWRIWQSSPRRYSRLGALVPDLLAAVECLLCRARWLGG